MLALALGGGGLVLIGGIVLTLALVLVKGNSGQQAAATPPINAQPVNQLLGNPPNNPPVKPPVNPPNNPPANPPVNPPANPPVNPQGGLPPEILSKIKAATVLIRVTLRDGRASGSGFVEAGAGLIMTNAHVLGMLEKGSPPPRKIEVVLNSGQGPALEKVVGASIVTVDRVCDLAVLRPVVPPGVTMPPGLVVNGAKGLQETQDLYVVGFPFGEQLGKNVTVSKTSVSSMRTDKNGNLDRVQVNGGMNPGNSGGPVVDPRGNVVGVAVSGIPGTQINNAIPGDRVNLVMAGRITEASMEEPFQRDGKIVVRVRFGTIDPLKAVQRMELDWWFGNPEQKVLATTKPADGMARHTVPVNYDPNFQQGTGLVGSWA